jgi:hypothetical protein
MKEETNERFHVYEVSPRGYKAVGLNGERLLLLTTGIKSTCGKDGHWLLRVVSANDIRKEYTMVCSHCDTTLSY